jgi:hypothetical protein
MQYTGMESETGIVNSKVAISARTSLVAVDNLLQNSRLFNYALGHKELIRTFKLYVSNNSFF